MKPCEDCGTPMFADTHAEGMGLCQTCNAQYFNTEEYERSVY